MFLWNIAIQREFQCFFFFFFPIFLMWHRWRSSYKRFSMSGNDRTEGLALMVERFLKNCQNRQKNWQKFLCHWMQPGHLQPHSFNNKQCLAINCNCCGGGCASPADGEILPQFATLLLTYSSWLSILKTFFLKILALLTTYLKAWT